MNHARKPKLDEHFVGPFTVIEISKANSNMVIIRDGDYEEQVNVKHLLRPWIGRERGRQDDVNLK